MNSLPSANLLPLLAAAPLHIDWSKVHAYLNKASHDHWVVVGLAGSFVFSIRFVIQWIASERAKKSIIPFGFWECSVLGSFLVLSYFIHERDLPGILQNLLPFPIYVRNVYLRWSHIKPKHPGNEPRPAE